MAHRVSLRFVLVLAFVLSSGAVQSARAVTSAEGFIARAMIISDLPDPIAEKLWDGIRVPLQSVIQAFGLREFSLQSRGVYTSLSLLLSRCRTDEHGPPPTTFSDRCVTQSIDMNDVPYAVAVILGGAPPRWTFEAHVYALQGKEDPLVFTTVIEADAQPELTAGLRAVLDYACVEIARLEKKLPNPARLPPDRGILLLVDPHANNKDGYVLIDKRHKRSLNPEHPLLLPGVTSVAIRRLNPDNSVLETDISTGMSPMIVVRNVRPLPRSAAPAAALKVDDTAQANQPNWWQQLPLGRKAGVILGGFGVLVGSAGGYLLLTGANQIEESQDKRFTYDEANDLFREGKDRQAVGLSGAIAGGGLAVVGAGLFFWEPIFGGSKSGSLNSEPPAGIIPMEDGAAFYAKFRF